jgi:hypothetical protein
MRRIATIGLIALLAGGVLPITRGATPAYAQAPDPRAEAQWQRFLSNDPALRAHPEWLSNQNYLRSHPNMTTWLHDHPEVFRQAREQGMWDRQGRWHNSSWWHDNDPDEFWRNHPEWAEHHRDWRGANDGDWDDQHNWRARNWWLEHRRDWVENHHPGWVRHNVPDEPLQHPGQHDHGGWNDHHDHHDHNN